MTIGKPSSRSDHQPLPLPLPVPKPTRAASFAANTTTTHEKEVLMADEEKKQAPSSDQQIAVQIDPQHGNGVYSNLMMISHRKEEFILDFMFLQPQRAGKGQSIATLRSRVITSPEHAKRILRALGENVARYESAYGTIQEATDIPKVMH